MGDWSHFDMEHACHLVTKELTGLRGTAVNKNSSYWANSTDTYQLCYSLLTSTDEAYGGSVLPCEVRGSQSTHRARAHPSQPVSFDNSQQLSILRTIEHDDETHTF